MTPEPLALTKNPPLSHSRLLAAKGQVCCQLGSNHEPRRPLTEFRVYVTPNASRLQFNFNAANATLELTRPKAPYTGESECRHQPASWKVETQTLAKANVRRAQLVPQLKLEPLSASEPKADAVAVGLIAPGAPQ